jgi:hypothetical protein
MVSSSEGAAAEMPVPWGDSTAATAQIVNGHRSQAGGQQGAGRDAEAPAVSARKPSKAAREVAHLAVLISKR